MLQNVLLEIILFTKPFFHTKCRKAISHTKRSLHTSSLISRQLPTLVGRWWYLFSSTGHCRFSWHTVGQVSDVWAYPSKNVQWHNHRIVWLDIIQPITVRLSVAVRIQLFILRRFEIAYIKCACVFWTHSRSQCGIILYYIRIYNYQDPVNTKQPRL